MLSNIRTLFSERTALIGKQITLARNLQHHYTSQQIPKTAQNYRYLQHLQREIQEKEKMISELVQVNNNLKFTPKK